MATEMTADRSSKTAIGGSLLEIVVAIGAVVVTILGLLGVTPLWMASVATLLVGAALLFEGAAIGAHSLATRPMNTRERTQLGGGTSVEIIGGIAGITLGVLALLRVTSEPLLLIAAANIVFGASLIIGSAATARIHRTWAHTDADRGLERTGRAASGAELLVGIAAVALGVLALLDIARLVLSLVGLLALGVTLLLSGSTISAHLAQLFGRHHGPTRAGNEPARPFE